MSRVFDPLNGKSYVIGSAEAVARGLQACAPGHVPLYTSGTCVEVGSPAYNESGVRRQVRGSTYVHDGQTWREPCVNPSGNLKCCTKPHQIPSVKTGACIDIAGPTSQLEQLEVREVNGVRYVAPKAAAAAWSTMPAVPSIFPDTYVPGGPISSMNIRLNANPALKAELPPKVTQVRTSVKRRKSGRRPKVRARNTPRMNKNRRESIVSSSTGAIATAAVAAPTFRLTDPAPASRAAVRAASPAKPISEVAAKAQDALVRFLEAVGGFIERNELSKVEYVSQPVDNVDMVQQIINSVYRQLIVKNKLFNVFIEFKDGVSVLMTEELTGIPESQMHKLYYAHLLNLMVKHVVRMKFIDDTSSFLQPGANIDNPKILISDFIAYVFDKRPDMTVKDFDALMSVFKSYKINWLNAFFTVQLSLVEDNERKQRAQGGSPKRVMPQSPAKESKTEDEPRAAKAALTAEKRIRKIRADVNVEAWELDEALGYVTPDRSPGDAAGSRNTSINLSTIAQIGQLTAKLYGAIDNAAAVGQSEAVKAIALASTVTPGASAPGSPLRSVPGSPPVTPQKAPAALPRSAEPVAESESAPQSPPRLEGQSPAESPAGSPAGAPTRPTAAQTPPSSPARGVAAEEPAAAAALEVPATAESAAQSVYRNPINLFAEAARSDLDPKNYATALYYMILSIYRTGRGKPGLVESGKYHEQAKALPIMSTDDKKWLDSLRQNFIVKDPAGLTTATQKAVYLTYSFIDRFAKIPMGTDNLYRKNLFVLTWRKLTDPEPTDKEITFDPTFKCADHNANLCPFPHCMVGVDRQCINRGVIINPTGAPFQSTRSGKQPTPEPKRPVTVSEIVAIFDTKATDVIVGMNARS